MLWGVGERRNNQERNGKRFIRERKEACYLEKEKAGGCFLASGMAARTRVRVCVGRFGTQAEARQTTQYFSKKSFGGLVEVYE